MAATIEVVDLGPCVIAVPHTNRLRCEGCHRFVGTVGTPQVTCTRCDVMFDLDIDGCYVEVHR